MHQSKGNVATFEEWVGPKCRGDRLLGEIQADGLALVGPGKGFSFANCDRSPAESFKDFMTAGFGEPILAGFAKNQVSILTENDEGLSDFGSRSPGSGEFVFPEDLAALHVHSKELSSDSFIAKAPHDMVADEEGVLKNHGKIPVLVEDLRFLSGDIQDGVSHAVSRGDEYLALVKNGVRSIHIIRRAPGMGEEHFAFFSEIIAYKTSPMENKGSVVPLVLK